jgi:Cysteine rich repeat
MNRTLPPLLAVAALLAVAGPARADLLQSCAAEVERYCAEVDKGQGRLTACLASRRDELTGSCSSSLQQASRNPLVPRAARRMLDPDFRAELPPSCHGAAASVCPDVPTGDGRVFACLYARSSQVGEECANTAEQTMGF